MSKLNKKSGNEVGREILQRLREYLNNIDELPFRNGEVNKTAVAKAACIPRQSLYTNPSCVELIEKTIGTKKVEHCQIDKKTVILERKIFVLEQKNAALVAEVYELRRKILQYKHIETVMEDGRRVML